MVDPVAIRFAQAGKGGLREVFAFSGHSVDGSVAFSLRHVLLRRAGQQNITVCNILVVHDRRTGASLCTHEQEDISANALRHMIKSGRWDQISCNFSSGSFFEISAGQLRGKMHTRHGSASWDMALVPGGQVFSHFASERLYTLGWPPVKLLAPDIGLGFSGRISCAGTVLSGDFSGASRHAWGAGRAQEYACASCMHFPAASDAFFTGMSARLPVLGEWITTPYFSLAALCVEGRWHAFNTLVTAPRHTVHALDNYRWLASFGNATHRLEVTVDGANPRVEPWVALQEVFPDGHVAVTKSTPFAAGRLRLYEKGGDTPLLELASDGFELETLLPDNIAVGDSLVGRA
jgi:hypothetical protein